MSDPAPKRRWYRFSLRTLFVVVIAAPCLIVLPYSQAKLALDRQQAREFIEGRGGRFTIDQEHTLPMNRRILGDRSVKRITIVSLCWRDVEDWEEEWDLASRMFPEAEITTHY